MPLVMHIIIYISKNNFMHNDQERKGGIVSVVSANALLTTRTTIVVVPRVKKHAKPVMGWVSMFLLIFPSMYIILEHVYLLDKAL